MNDKCGYPNKKTEKKRYETENFTLLHTILQSTDNFRIKVNEGITNINLPVTQYYRDGGENSSGAGSNV